MWSNFVFRVFDENLSGEVFGVLLFILIYDVDFVLKIKDVQLFFYYEIDFGGCNWIFYFYFYFCQIDDGVFDLVLFIFYGGLVGSLLLVLLVFYLSMYGVCVECYVDLVMEEFCWYCDYLYELVEEWMVWFDEVLQQVCVVSQVKLEFFVNMLYELCILMYVILSFFQFGIRWVDGGNQV